MIKTIIVEDDVMVATINREFALRTPGIQISAAFRNGREALDYLKKTDADLVLLDLYMPDYSGLELLAELRRQNIHVDVIMITAANDTEHINEALHLGIVDYLIKPFQYNRFAEAIDKYLIRRKSMTAGSELSQSEIDRLIGPGAARSAEAGCEYKKGIQSKTLDRIRLCLKNHVGSYLTSEEIAAETGLSKVTIRRYMNYLIEQNEIVSRVDYSTGGRPRVEYLA
ncbi:MAG: response regulator [Eubacteriaceae bacterium]|jgi:response regulator of citrate/malate metabolism